MIINQIDTSENDIKELLEDIKKQKYAIDKCRLEFDMGAERATAGRKGMEYAVSRDAFDQFRTGVNVALDEMWKDYEKLCELGAVKIVQAHR